MVKAAPLVLLVCLGAPPGCNKGETTAGAVKPGEGAPAVSGKSHKQYEVVRPDTEWRRRLTDMQFYVTRQKGTERAFSGEHWNNHKEGVYRCVACDQPLYDSKTKFESGTGWPSFWDAVSAKAVDIEEDRSWFSVRSELLCSRCGSHLGHVFDDGPPPTGKRHCINSAALKFVGKNPDGVAKTQP